ncbi:MAG TPA: amidohydrolase family protein, partial [Pseudonocardiaceae bacterium]|nr:amidohydrolase family protein [Pseudonocardiaceae bacterium]
MRISADLALVNADVVTMNPARPHATAVAARAGRIIAVGDDAETRDHCDGRTEILDLHGACLLPGLTDGHLHPVLGLDLTAGVDLADCATIDAVRARLAATPSVDGWVRGYGLDPNVFVDGVPRADLFEDVLRGVPAFLWVNDGHSVLASHAALAMA